jgi:plastocyanin
VAIATAATAMALAAGPTPRVRHHVAHTVKACRRSKHHRCPRTRRHKHRKPVKPTGTHRNAAGVPGVTGGTATPGPAGELPGAPAAIPVPGESSSPGGGATPESPAEPPPPTHVQVTAQDTEGFRFVLSRTTVPAGKVIIEFVNHGQDEHNLHTLEPGEGSEGGSLPNTAPGGHPQLSLEMRPGSYTLFCSLPGHEAKGMKATLVVQ